MTWLDGFGYPPRLTETGLYPMPHGFLLLKHFSVDFINKYRIEEARKRLLDPRKAHLTILAIAYDVGFSSKSPVFNSAFKKHTQMTIVLPIIAKS